VDLAETEGRIHQEQDFEVSTLTPAQGRGRGSRVQGTTGRQGRGQGQERGRGQGRGQQNRVDDTQGGTGPASSATIQLGTPAPDTP
jgi:hypothetical protein